MIRDRSRRTEFVVGLTVLAIVCLLAAVASLIAPQSSPRDVVAMRFLPPLARDVAGQLHVMGTDRLGRDVLWRLLAGARVSLAVGVLTMALSLVIGTAIGSIAAFGSGLVRALALGLTDFALSVPRVVLLLLLSALWQPGLTQVVLVLAATGWMPLARLVYAESRSQLGRAYVAGATALGASTPRVWWHHVLPHATPAILGNVTLGIGYAITLEAGLSFLGLGVQPPTPSWGSMIASGRDTVVNAPWVGLAPGVALVLVVVSCTLIADALGDQSSATTMIQRNDNPNVTSPNAGAVNVAV